MMQNITLAVTLKIEIVELTTARSLKSSALCVNAVQKEN